MADISSNGTGGGDFTVGASWSGGSAPGAGDTAIILDGDEIRYDRDDSSKALEVLKLGYGSTFVIEEGNTCWVGTFNQNDYSNYVRYFVWEAGATLKVENIEAYFTQTQFSTSGTSLAAMASFEHTPTSGFTRIYIDDSDVIGSDRTAPWFDCEYLRMVRIHPCQYNGDWYTRIGRMKHCVFDNCGIGGIWEFYECCWTASYAYTSHMFNTGGVYKCCGFFDRCATGYSAFTESPFTPTTASIQTVYGVGVGPYRNGYSNYTSFSFTNLYQSHKLVEATMPNLLKMGNGTVVNGNGSSQYGSELLHVLYNQWEVEKVTDPYAGAAQGNVLRIKLLDTTVTPYGRSIPFEIEIPVEHGDVVAPSIKFYLTSGWTGFVDDWVELTLDPADEWGLRETANIDSTTTDAWQTVSFTGGTVTRSSGDKGVLVLRVWLNFAYVASKYLYLDDVKLNAS